MFQDIWGQIQHLRQNQEMDLYYFTSTILHHYVCWVLSRTQWFIRPSLEYVCMYDRLTFSSLLSPWATDLCGWSDSTVPSRVLENGDTRTLTQNKCLMNQYETPYTANYAMLSKNSNFNPPPVEVGRMMHYCNGYRVSLIWLAISAFVCWPKASGWSTLGSWPM